jgi:hypothetical protein
MNYQEILPLSGSDRLPPEHCYPAGRLVLPYGLADPQNRSPPRQ